MALNGTASWLFTPVDDSEAYTGLDKSHSQRWDCALLGLLVSIAYWTRKDRSASLSHCRGVLSRVTRDHEAQQITEKDTGVTTLIMPLLYLQALMPASTEGVPVHLRNSWVLHSITPKKLVLSTLSRKMHEATS